MQVKQPLIAGPQRPWVAWLLSLCAASCLFATPALAQSSSLPEQNLLVGYSTVSTTKQTISTTQNYTLPLGFVTEYSIFLNPVLAVGGQFQINLSGQSIVYLGGAAGLMWYFMGGSNERDSDEFVSTKINPHYNLFGILAFGGRQYNFAAVEEQPEDGQGRLRDARDDVEGSALGLVAGLGFNYPYSFNVLPGIRVQQVIGFESETEPTINSTEIWLSCAFVL